MFFLLSIVWVQFNNTKKDIDLENFLKKKQSLNVKINLTSDKKSFIIQCFKNSSNLFLNILRVHSSLESKHFTLTKNR